MKSEIVSIYENIYNQELIFRNNLDNKFTSRLTLLLTLVTAVSVVITTIAFPNQNSSSGFGANLNYIYLICIFIISFLTFLMCFSFYRCFFRMKMNYLVMPTIDIRMFHFYLHRNNLINSKEEEDLYSYLVDSYQRCAFENASINAKREKALILFDNTASFCFVLLIFVYIGMKLYGYSIEWIF